MHKVVLTRLAELEIEEASDWYDLQRPGLGDEFRDQVERDARALGETPQRWPVYESDIRRYVMSRFPYLIYYHTGADVVTILRVVHGRRDPEAIRRNLV
jgi:plasmid stabilization system protein ParE